MPIHRKRFRIEEAFVGDVTSPEIVDSGGLGPMHNAIMAELGAVVGGTEQATQQILEATEAIDQAATALSRNTSPDQQKLLSEEIQERVVSIFEACNFQDLTGQRISKVMNTMKFIEQHISAM